MEDSVPVKEEQNAVPATQPDGSPHAHKFECRFKDEKLHNLP